MRQLDGSPSPLRSWKRESKALQSVTNKPKLERESALQMNGVEDGFLSLWDRNWKTHHHSIEGVWDQNEEIAVQNGRQAGSGRAPISLLTSNQSTSCIIQTSYSTDNFEGVLNVETGNANFKFTYKFSNRYLKSNNNVLHKWIQSQNWGSGVEGQDLGDNANFTPNFKPQIDGQAKTQSVNFSWDSV